jgi:putative sugar O-methyltransferase
LNQAEIAHYEARENSMRVAIDALRSLYEALVRNEEINGFYDRFPRNFFWDKGNRECSTTIIREAADTLDLIHRMQGTDLFGVNTNTEIKTAAVEWLIRKYESDGIDIDLLPSTVQESLHSRPDISIDHKGRLLSIDFLRTVSVCADIQKYLQKSRPPLSVLELGGGLGHLARTMRLTGISKSHIILDLPETLIFSYAFLTVNFPDAAVIFITDREQAAATQPAAYDFVFVPSCFAGDIDFGSAELFVNTASLGEMNNATIRYWMEFVQRRTSIKYLFTQNRFLNTIDPVAHAWRWNENECSVHYDSSWTIQKWDLEPRWFQCPYIVPLAARHLEIAATREVPLDQLVLANRAERLLDEVKHQDWFRLPDEPGYMTMRHNRFVTDVTINGPLFKLWESLRLFTTADAVFVLLRYLETLAHNSAWVFEETSYYQQLFLRLADADPRAEFASYAVTLRAKLSSHPISTKVELVGATADYNIVLATIGSEAAGTHTSKRYYAIDKAIGSVDLFRERLGDRELAPRILIADTYELAVKKARDHEQPEVQLIEALDGYNIVRVESAYYGVAQSLGPITLFQDRVGEKELVPVLLKASTYEEIRERIALETDRMRRRNS